MKYTSLVLGNSSSGVVETPAFGTPTVNIGDRQKGRMQGESIINCAPCADSIAEAIQTALSPTFREIARNASNPYGDGNTSGKIAEIVHDHLIHEKLVLKKKFYDVDF